LTDPHVDDLIRRYLERTATQAELAELERCLGRAECAAAFAEVCRWETWLSILLKEESQVVQTRARCHAIDRSRRRAARTWRGVAVAVSVLIICFGLWWFFGSAWPPAPRMGTSPERLAQRPTTLLARADTSPATSPRMDQLPVAAAVATLGIITANAVR
jgi:hypothetical protein